MDLLKQQRDNEGEREEERVRTVPFYMCRNNRLLVSFGFKFICLNELQFSQSQLFYQIDHYRCMQIQKLVG